MTKEQIQCVKDGLSRQKLYIALGCIEELEKENERLKEQIDKMKCCSNCNGKFLSTRCSLCKDKSKWELVE